MDLELISVVADSTAAFGVIASLIFVAYSVRQNSKGHRFAAVHAQTTSFQTAVAQLVATPDMADIMWRGSQDADKLEGAERIRFDIGVNNLLRALQTIQWEWRHGVFDDELFTGITTGFRNMVALPGVTIIWNNRRKNFTSDYQAYIDNLIIESSGKSDYWSLKAEPSE